MKMKKYTALVILFLVIMGPILTSVQTRVSVSSLEPISILLDAGHGGEDPGKVVGEIKESEINLNIALKLKDHLEEAGYEVTMTRTKEEGLSYAGNAWEKSSDMQIRKNMITSGGYDMFISIHQNSHSDVSCKGGQVFYSDNNAENRILAEIIQHKLKECTPFENKRAALINNDYKLLKGNSMPSVIVECGFMTNQTELELLLSEDYQEKIAKYISQGIYDYIEKEKQ